MGFTCCSSIAILIYGYAIFQKRLTMISARDAAQFGTSPLARMSVCLFDDLCNSLLCSYRSTMGSVVDLRRHVHRHLDQLYRPGARNVRIDGRLPQVLCLIRLCPCAL